MKHPCTELDWVGLIRLEIILNRDRSPTLDPRCDEAVRQFLGLGWGEPPPNLIEARQQSPKFTLGSFQDLDWPYP